MAIEWREKMSVGNESVDKDHRNLIELVNSFERSMDTFDTTGNFIVALKQLEEYSKQHFDREEMYQELIGYPGLEQHRISHHELIIQLRIDAKIKSHFLNPGEVCLKTHCQF